MDSIRQVVIPCGGKGTRLGSLTKSVPKPLVQVGDRPLLDHTLELIERQGFEEVLLVAGHLGEQIEERYRDARFGNLRVKVVREPLPLGTAGFLSEIDGMLDEEFALVYGDIFLDFSLRSLAEDFIAHGPLATLLARPSDHPWDSHLIAADADGRVSEFISRQEPGKLYRNIANAAVYILSRKILKYIPKGSPCDFGKDVFPAALAAGEDVRIHWLEERGWVRDMGSPDRLAEVERYIARRKIAKSSLGHPDKVRLVLLDRDGTINHFNDHVTRPDQLVVGPESKDAIRELHAAGLKLAVVTNQPGIARGLFTEPALTEIHAKLNAEIEDSGGKLDAIYFSPFHPETHHGEGIAELRRSSECRKPHPGMLFKAMEEFDATPAQTVMVGDSAADIVAGQLAGCRTILVGSNPSQAALAAAPDRILPTLKEAARVILDEWR